VRAVAPASGFALVAAEACAHPVRFATTPLRIPAAPSSLPMLQLPVWRVALLLHAPCFGCRLLFARSASCCTFDLAASASSASGAPPLPGFRFFLGTAFRLFTRLGFAAAFCLASSASSRALAASVRLRRASSASCCAFNFAASISCLALASTSHAPSPLPRLSLLPFPVRHAPVRPLVPLSLARLPLLPGTAFGFFARFGSFPFGLEPGFLCFLLRL